MMDESVRNFQWIVAHPISYMHPKRLELPRLLQAPRQRAIINKMLLKRFGLCESVSVPKSATEWHLIRHWKSLPYICMLTGAQLLKSELAWRGEWLKLSSSVRFFALLPIMSHCDISQSGDRYGINGANHNVRKSPIFLPSQIQGLGLRCLLDWQCHTSMALLKRMQLLFSPDLDAYFETPRKSPEKAHIFLMLQAIQYAKNYPDLV